MTPAPREGAASTKALNDYMSLGPAPHTRACAATRREPCDCGGVNLLHQARTELSNVEARLTALLSEADAARAKAIEDVVRLCKEREDHLERTSKRLDRDGQMEHYHRILEADFIGRAIKALAAQDRAKENKNG